MIIYYIIWFVLCVFVVCEITSSNNPQMRLDIRRCVCIFSFLVFFCLVGFKGNVGSDYLQYLNKYEIIAELDHYDYVYSIEPGFWYWMKLLSLFSKSFIFFWFVTSLFNIALKTYVFTKLSPIISISFAIYFVGLFFERDFDGIRQGISIGICYVAIYYYAIQNKKLLSYLLFALACSFHYTSIVFAIVPILKKKDISNKFIYFSLIAAIIMVLTNHYVINPSLLTLGYGNMITSKISDYAISDKYSSQVGLSVGILFRIFLLLLFVKLKNKLNINESLYNIYKGGFYIAIMSSLLFNNFEIISHRLAYGYRELQIFIIPYIVYSFKNRHYRLIVALLCIIYSFWLLHRLLNSNMQHYYYYKTFFE